MAISLVPDMLVLVMRGWIREGLSLQIIVVHEEYSNIGIVEYLGHIGSREHLSFIYSLILTLDTTNLFQALDNFKTA